MVCVRLFVLLHWDFSHGKFGLLSPGKASYDRIALPNPGCMVGVLVLPYFTELLSRTKRSLTFAKMSRGCTDAVRESALKVDSWRKIPCCTGESKLRQRRAGPTLYQLSYIPNPPQMDKKHKLNGILSLKYDKRSFSVF